MHLLQTTKYLFVKSDIWKQLQERWLSTKLWPIGPSSALRHKKFSKPAKKIKEIKIEWKKKIKLHQKETHSEKRKVTYMKNQSNMNFWRYWKMRRFTSLSQLRKKIGITESSSKMKKSKAVVYTIKLDTLEWFLFLRTQQLMSSILNEIIKILLQLRTQKTWYHIWTKQRVANA